MTDTGGNHAANHRRPSTSHRIMLAHEILMASIVMVVVVCATVLTLVKASSVSSDLLSFVYGGAIAYAGGRAAAARMYNVRQVDVHASGEAPDA